MMFSMGKQKTNVMRAEDAIFFTTITVTGMRERKNETNAPDLPT